jgi:pseudaminic acid cytidylyltransferase
MNICIIPARGGSKRIPRKNIRDFHGKPVISYSIETALESNLFDVVMVSTDDEEIANISLSIGAKVPFFRSKKNSDDLASTVDVLEEVISNYQKFGKNFDNICCLYPVTPLTRISHLQNGLTRLNEGYDSVFPIITFSFPIWRSLEINDEKIKWIWPENASKRSQDLPQAFHDAGQWYWIKTEKLLEKKQILTDNTGFILLDETESQDVDNDSDWKMMEIKYRFNSLYDSIP